MNSLHPSAASRHLHSSRVGSETMELDWTYLPGRTDGSQAPPAWWRTLPAGRCARTCTPPCLWSAAALASSGTGSCWGHLSAAFSHCSKATAEGRVTCVAKHAWGPVNAHRVWTGVEQICLWFEKYIYLNLSWRARRNVSQICWI